jgi:Tautomerase enzyme
MPILTFDVIKGRTESVLRKMLDAAHEAVLEAFGVPRGDRYQFVTEHEPSRMIIEDTGLGIRRTRDVVVLRLFTRPRSREAKIAFYRVLTDKLQSACSIAPSDVVVSIFVNGDEDWSFGLGRAQYLTGEL